MSKKAKLSLEVAKKMYKSTDEGIREFAIANYPELDRVITDRVLSFQDACQIKGIDPESSFFTSDVLQPHEKAQRKIETIVEVLNEGWKPNWDDSNEYKYRPWFKMSSSGVGFSCFAFGYAYSGSFVGSRLVFKSRELAEYAGKTFTSIYQEMFTL